MVWGFTYQGFYDLGKFLSHTIGHRTTPVLSIAENMCNCHIPHDKGDTICSGAI